ncbi:MAG TPA: M13 family metallopeptidase [Candidatus Angelobacter sp.]|jgi:endothelin-converting enzyme/putative endopeptidase|nr:M13 family metallopeptidase [Candidatus Angelobacter sp.]
MTRRSLNVLGMKAIMSAGILCATVLAQTNAPPLAGPEKPPRLSPGLDKEVIDPAADPCVDFFQYACGNFSKLYPIPNDRPGYGTGAMIGDYTEYTLHAMLEKAAAGGASRSSNEQKIGDYYAACLNTDAIDAKGLKPLQPELDRIAKLKRKDELPPLLAHYKLIGVGGFLEFGEQQDFKDASKQIAAVDQGGLGLPERDYYFRTGEVPEKTRKQYVEHITNVMKLMGEPESQASSDAQKIMELETALAKVSMDITSQRDPQKIYHLMPVTELKKLTPAIDWNLFLKESDTPPIREINVTNPDFFKGLNSLIGSTDLETIKTYLRWQLIRSTPSNALPKAFDQEHFDFYSRKLSGQPEQRARWKRCVQSADGALGEALGQVYVAQEFPPANKQATLQMVHDIEAAMDQDLDTLDWMSPDTKARAKQKLHAIADKIGYPDHWRDYSKLKVARDDAYGNSIRSIEFENRRQLAKIGKPVDRGEWGISPATVDAYYNPSMNDINFPAGILQSPFYDKNAPDAVNYGHVGGVIGHELTHGFDDEGRQFDAHGNLSDWWTPEDAKKFEERADCEVKEYGSFVVVDDVKINGKLTLGENTADNGGLRLAFMAFLADAKRKNIDVDQKQEGYTPIQQFFLAHGQNWCGSSRPESMRLQAQTDPHSFRKFRVNGVVQNMLEFGKAFGCKTGQPMMPVNACRVW